MSDSSDMDGGKGGAVPVSANYGSIDHRKGHGTSTVTFFLLLQCPFFTTPSLGEERTALCFLTEVPTEESMKREESVTGTRVQKKGKQRA